MSIQNNPTRVQETIEKFIKDMEGLGATGFALFMGTGRDMGFHIHARDNTDVEGLLMALHNGAQTLTGLLRNADRPRILLP